MKNKAPIWSNDLFDFQENRAYQPSEWAQAIQASSFNPFSAITSNPDLPCPRRLEITGNTTCLFMLNKAEQEIVKNIRPGQFTAFEFMNFMEYHMPSKALDYALGGGYRANPQGFAENCVKILHLAEGGRTYTVRNDTANMLEKTKISQDIPLDMLRSPELGITYVELGDNKPAMPSITIQNPDQPHLRDPIEGFYFYENELDLESAKNMLVSSKQESLYDVVTNVFGYQGFSSIRTLSFHFQSAVNLGRPDPLNTGYTYLKLFIPVFENSKNLSLSELLDKQFEWWKSDPVVVEQLEYSQDMQAEIKARKELMFAATLICLYITSSNYRDEFSELTKARQRIINSGTKKLPNARKKSLRSVDRIYVSPKLELDENTKDYLSGKGKKSFHLRSGHIRMQAFGKDRAERKMIWVKPMLINAEKNKAHADLIRHKKF